MPKLRESSTLRVGQRLPDVGLPRPDGAVRALRGAHRDAVVVVVLHDADCERCRDYLRALAAAAPRFRIWDGSVGAVTDAPHPDHLQAELDPDIDVLIDAERTFLDRVQAHGGFGGRAGDRAGDRAGNMAGESASEVPADGPVVLVADRYGQLFEILPAGPDHVLVEPRELEEWLKYLATQCPE